MAYLCGDCNEPINREEIDYFNGLPMHPGCKLANMINEACSYEEALEYLLSFGYGEDEAIFKLKDYDFGSVMDTLTYGLNKRFLEAWYLRQISFNKAKFQGIQDWVIHNLKEHFEED